MGVYTLGIYTLVVYTRLGLPEQTESRKQNYRGPYHVNILQGTIVLQNKSYMPDVTLHFGNADVMDSKAENILQSINYASKTQDGRDTWKADLSVHKH